ncbi:MAG: hypothetical protein C4341_09340 [Armatimonadota bacterium]
MVSPRVCLSAIALAPMCAVAQLGPLPDDGRLTARVTLSHPVATIETLLDDLSNRTGVRLTADASVKEDLIVLRVKNVAAREVMERVASHFDWSWRAEDGGYVLFQSKEQKEREQKAYAEQLLLPLQRSQEAMRKWLPSIERDFEQNRARLREARERFRQVSPPNPEWGELYDEVERLEGIATPVALYTARLFLSINDEQYEQMIERGCLVFALTPTAAQWRVPQGLRDQAREVAADLGLDTTGVTSFEVIVAFSHNEDSIYSAESLPVDHADIAVLDSSGRVVATQTVFLPDVFLNNVGQRVIPHSDDRLRGRIIRSEAFDELVATGWPGTRRRLASESLAYLARGSNVPPMRGYGRLAVLVADALDLNLLADAHALWGPPSEALRMREADILVGGLFRDTWQLEDGWINARSSTWAVYRRHAVRVGRLRAVRDNYLASGGLSVGALAQYGREFSFFNLLDPFFSLTLDGTTEAPWAAAATKFFGTLTPAQLAHLAAGDALPA